MFMAIYYVVKSRNVVWWFLGFTVLMGLARIYCGVHYPSDILSGAVIGILSAWFIRTILPVIKTDENNS
jgi:undecaprenyl-diphosphatase